MRSFGAFGSRTTWIKRRKLSFSTTNLIWEEGIITKKHVQGLKFKACPERSEGSSLIDAPDPSKLRMREARTLNPEL
jgi:hypothetical protein